MRCAIYARYSSNLQNPRSIADQVAKCRQYAKDKGWKVLDAHVYTDEAVSGATTERPGYQRLKKAISQGGDSRTPCPFDAVLSEDMSRLWRDQEEQSRALKLMAFANVRLMFCDGSDDSSSLLLSVKGAMSEEYRKELGIRTIRGLRGNVEEGLHTGGRCFGYQNVALAKEPGPSKRNPTKLIVDPEQAAVVIRIFTMYAQGRSLSRIAKTLNAEHVRSPRPQAGRIQQSWAPSSIRVILHNTRYRGIVTYGKTKKVNNPLTDRRIKRAASEATMIRREFPEQRIISEELWNQVRRRIAKVKEVYGERGRLGGLAHVGNAAGNPFIFSGLLKCAECGANLTIVSGKGKNHGHSSYGCPTNKFRGTCSNSVRIRKDVLETQMLSKIQSEVLRDEVIEYTLSRFESELKKQVHQITGQMGQLEAKRKKLEKELFNLTKAIASGLDSPAVRGEIVDRETQIRAINEQIISSKPESVKGRIQDARKFVESNLRDIRCLLGADPRSAKAAIAQHMPKIVMKPTIKPDGQKVYQAISEWELLEGGTLGTYSGAESAKRRAALLGGAEGES